MKIVQFDGLGSEILQTKRIALKPWNCELNGFGKFEKITNF